MRRHQIPQKQIDIMRRQFIRGDETGYRIAKKLGISTVTSWRYMTEFKRIKAAFPEKLNDMSFFMPEEPKQHRMTPLYVQFLRVLPRLLADEKPGVKAKPVWRKYRKLYPQGYAYLPFTELFYIWIKENDVPAKPPIIQSMPEGNLKILKKWKRSANRRKWQIATTLIMALETSCYKDITGKTEATFQTIKSWISTYEEKGLSAFELSKHKIFPNVIKRMKSRADKVIKLLHESPKMHGLNRTSWTITALAETYEKVYAEKISWMQTAYTLKQNGYRFKKSRDMLTSKDPKFREKIKKLQNVLRRLKKDEKFFSIDEYGPVGVKIRGGRMLKKDNEDYQIPDKQKHKGVVICTAALELSTNQVTHFYSTRKNTFETIKLVEMLISEYPDQKRIFLCWDNVSWHRSNILLDFIKEHNNESRPLVVPMPLPSSAQFLNVIESVFGGLARAVIHNSNYDSLEDCKAAIDRHFMERNGYFKNHPKRAGNKIWGKESVAPRFCETQKCRDRRAMRGADQK